jgi:hypothetical protein
MAVRRKGELLGLCSKYHYGDQAKENEMGGACNTKGEMQNAHKFAI